MFEIENPRQLNRFTTHNHDIKAYFNMPWEYKYKDNDRGEKWVRGRLLPSKEHITVKLFLLTKAEARAMHPYSAKPRRMHAQCPECHKLVCAGHTFQHICEKVK